MLTGLVRECGQGGASQNLLDFWRSGMMMCMSACAALQKVDKNNAAASSPSSPSRISRATQDARPHCLWPQLPHDDLRNSVASVITSSSRACANGSPGGSLPAHDRCQDRPFQFDGLCIIDLIHQLLLPWINRYVVMPPGEQRPSELLLV